MKLTKADYDRAIAGLREVDKQIAYFLERGRAAAHRNTWEVSPGIRISNDFKSFDEAMAWLWSILPK